MTKIKAIFNVILLTIIMTICMNIEAFAASKPGDITIGICVVSPSYTTINWNAASGATGYEVKYKKASEGSYKTVTTSKNKYTFTNFSDTTYYFKIRAYNKSGYGSTKSFSFKNYKAKATFKVWYNAQSGCTVLKCTDVTGITLNKKVYNVTGYQAAIANSGKYTLLKTIKNATYSVTSISQQHKAQDYAMRYYTTVRQPNGIKTQYFSDYKTMTVIPTPGTPEDVYAYTNGNRVTVRWSIPYNGADGYRIYVSKKQKGTGWSNWEWTKTVYDGKATSYSFDGDAGTAYRIKISSISINPTYSSTNLKNENESVFSDTSSCSTSGYINVMASSEKKAYSFKNYDGLIIVGDSRSEYMSKQSGITSEYPNTIFIALSGSGYDYLESTAAPLLREYLNSGKRYIVVFNHGVNDLDNISKYRYLYTGFIHNSSYNEHAFYFMSVNPLFDGCRIDRNNGGFGSTNKRVESFNNNMRAYFGKNNYLDCYTNMLYNGYDSYDGIHYCAGTNSQIMRFILEELFSKGL